MVLLTTTVQQLHMVLSKSGMIKNIGIHGALAKRCAENLLPLRTCAITWCFYTRHVPKYTGRSSGASKTRDTMSSQTIKFPNAVSVLCSGQSPYPKLFLQGTEGERTLDELPQSGQHGATTP